MPHASIVFNGGAFTESGGLWTATKALDVTFTIEPGSPVVTKGDFVLASTLTEEHEEVTIGIADAIAFGADGAPQVVIDWKSDVDLASETLEHYSAQLRAYLDATLSEPIASMRHGFAAPVADTVTDSLQVTATPTVLPIPRVPSGTAVGCPPSLLRRR